MFLTILLGTLALVTGIVGCLALLFSIAIGIGGEFDHGGWFPLSVSIICLLVAASSSVQVIRLWSGSARY